MTAVVQLSAPGKVENALLQNASKSHEEAVDCFKNDAGNMSTSKNDHVIENLYNTGWNFTS